MGARTYWSSPVPPLGSADGASAATTSLVDVSPSPQIVMPAYLAEVGTKIRVSMYGSYWSASTTPLLSVGFFTAGVGTAIGSATVVGTTATTAVSASAVSWPFIMQYQGQVRALGSSGSLVGQGFAKQGTSLTVFATQDLAIPITAAGRTVTLNTTQANYIACGVVWTSATGSPSFICNDLTVELLG